MIWFNLITYWLGHYVSADYCKSDSPAAITCSKLTIETLEQGVKYVQS